MSDVAKFYHTVIDDVITGMQDAFVEDGLDKEVLLELKKLWTSKLSETRVFDPEPTTQTAAQYAHRFQPPVQIPPPGFNRMPIQQNPTIAAASQQRAFAPMIRSNPPLNAQMQSNQTGQPTNMISSVGQSNIALIRPVMHPQGNRIVVATALNPMNQQQAMVQQRPANLMGLTIRGGLTTTNGQQATILAPSVSGVNGEAVQFVQIGQQTYFVPQPLIQPRPQTTIASALQQQQTDQSTVFHRTQVDGVGDGSDDDFDQFSEPPSIRQPMSISSRRGGGCGSGMTPGLSTGPHNDLTSDDDDDDDADLVPATPGLTPPASALSATGLTPRPRGRHITTPFTPLLPPASNMAAPDTPSSCDHTLSVGILGATPVSSGSMKRGRSPALAASASGSKKPSESASKRPALVTGTDTQRRLQSAYDSDDYDDYDDDDDVDDMGVNMTPGGHIEDSEAEGGRTPVGVRSDGRRGIVRSRAPKVEEHSTGLASRQNGKATSCKVDASDIRTDEEEEPSVGQADEEEKEEEEEEDEEPLNSGDDVSEEEPEILFQSENVVVCQYDKIQRSRNKWKFYLKDGIMALHGRDYIFQKATGEAEW